MKKILGKKLSDARKKAHMTQAFVANKLDIGSNTVSGYESGYRSPSAEMLLKLAELYNVSLDNLLGRVYKDNVFISFGMALQDSYDKASLEIIKLLDQLYNDEKQRTIGYIVNMIEQKKTGQ